MKKVLFTLLCLILLSIPVRAQNATANLTAQGTTCGASAASSLTLRIGGATGGVTFTLAGTWSGTVSFYASGDDGKTYQPFNVTASNSTTAVTTATSPGIFQANAAAYTNFCALVTTYSSGTVAATIQLSVASASSGSHGAGVGSVSGQASGVVPLGTSATVIGQQSHLDDGNTTAGTVTSSESIAAPRYASRALSQPSTPTVTPTGGSGTTWSYVVVARYGNLATGSDGTNIGTTATGAATLDVTHYNTISWAAVSGATGYDVYRTTAGTSPVTVGLLTSSPLSAGTISFVDNGVAANCNAGFCYQAFGGMQNTTGEVGALGQQIGPDFAHLGGVVQNQSVVPASLQVYSTFDQAGYPGTLFNGTAAAFIVHDSNGSSAYSNGLQVYGADDLIQNSTFNIGVGMYAIAGSKDGLTPYTLGSNYGGFTFSEWDGPGSLGDLVGVEVFPNQASGPVSRKIAGVEFADQGVSCTGGDCAPIIASAYVDPQTNGSYSLYTAGAGPVSLGDKLTVRSGLITSSTDGTHPGNLSFGGNTTVVAPATNTFNLMGPSSATFTAYGLQFPNAAPAAHSLITTGAPTSAVSQATYTVVPNCTDTAGNHLNYTQSTDLFSCGTTSSGGGTAFPVTVSGTVNSGGIPCFTSTTNEASSAAIAVNDAIVGGGAGACAKDSGVPIILPDSGSATTSIGIGTGALTSQTGVATGNTAVGYQAANAMTGNDGTVAVGYQALKVATGQNNTALGWGAAVAVTTGISNTALGDQTLQTDISGGSNTAVGIAALQLTTGGSATAVGALALQNTTAQNDALGAQAGQNISTGSFNVAIGSNAMKGSAGNQVTGIDNTAVGGNALQNVQTTAANNTAVGFQALQNDSTGINNTAVGFDAILSIGGTPLTGNNNTAIGRASLNSIQGAAAGNTAIGYQSGFSGTALTTGTNNTFLGFNAAASTATDTNEYVIGASTTGSGSNTGVIGNSSVTDAYFGSTTPATTLRAVGMISMGTAPTITGTGACSSIGSKVGGPTAGSFACTGTTGASTITITPGKTAPNGWTCNVYDETTRADNPGQTSHTTTTCVVTSTATVSSDVFSWSAVGY